MSSGLKAINERAKQQQKQQTSYIRKLTLSDGEKAWFRFLATGDEDDHRYQDFAIHRMKTPDGKFGWEYCSADDDEGEVCKNCLTMKQSFQFGVWVWVDYILRKRDNPARKDNPNATPWKPVKFLDEKYYLQEVNGVRLWMSGPGQKRYILRQVLDAYDSFGTLMDRQYVMSREGSEKENTNYSLKPVAEKSGLTEQQLEEYRKLPPVRDVVSGRQSYPPRTETAEPTGDDFEEFNAPTGTSVMVNAAAAIESEEEEIDELPWETKSSDSDVDDAIAKALSSIDESEEDETITRVRKPRK